jgi:pimeloyl-ACP methyl ester carboxylesterase
LEEHMTLTVDGKTVFAATGGRPFDPAKPAIIFLHGAGGDRTVWMSLARWAAHHGWSVLAPDLPGHGRSDGPALTSIAAMSAWVEALMRAVKIERAALAGHSMGGAIAIETAARLGNRVTHLVPIGTAATIAVGPALLEAAKTAPVKAYDMMTEWALAPASRMGRNPAPGMWMAGGVRSVFGVNADDVLYADLAACAAWTTGPEAAKRIVSPTHVIAAERDIMTAAKKGRELAGLIPGASFTLLPAVGHMIMQEAPDAVLAALRTALAAPMKAA